MFSFSVFLLFVCLLIGNIAVSLGQYHYVCKEHIDFVEHRQYDDYANYVKCLRIMEKLDKK